VVRPADPAAGYTIPASPAERSRVGTRVRLDEAALAAKLAEAAEIAALLDSVFADDERQSMASAAPRPPDVELVAGLDAGHSALLYALAGRDMISRADWERLTIDARLMPDGALDRINEAAYDAVGEPVTDGDDPLEINQYVMGELL